MRLGYKGGNLLGQPLPSHVPRLQATADEAARFERGGECGLTTLDDIVATVIAEVVDCLNHERAVVHMAGGASTVVGGGLRLQCVALLHKGSKQDPGMDALVPRNGGGRAGAGNCGGSHVDRGHV